MMNAPGPFIDDVTEQIVTAIQHDNIYTWNIVMEFERFRVIAVVVVLHVLVVEKFRVRNGVFCTINTV